MAFQPPYLIADDRTVIAFKFIESMKLFQEEEDQTIDKLKDDLTIDIRTSSGVEYSISTKMQYKVFSSKHKLSNNIAVLRAEIFERWASYLQKD